MARLLLSSEAWRFGPDWPGDRCCAKTRSGAPCKNPIVSGRKRCRLHGGAAGSGAPSGEKHGRYKHGRFSKERVARGRAERLQLRELMQLGKALGLFV